MSLTPSLPNMQKLKSFWERPEGKVGAAVLGIGAAAIGYKFYVALPDILEHAIDFTELVYVGLFLVGTGFVVLDKGFRNTLKNIFQITMRAFTSIVITIDPIGILENTVDDMKENNEKLGDAVEKTAGSKREVQDQMAKNTEAINHANSIKKQAEIFLKAERDPLKVQRFELSRKAQLQEADRRLAANQNLQVLLDQTNKMYGMLVRYQQLAEYNIQNTEAEVNNAKEQKKVIDRAYSGLKFAKKIFKGDSEQQKAFNQSLELLAESNSMKVGAMEDFYRYSEKYLDQMDLEQAAGATDAEAKLAEYENKLLEAGSIETVPASMPMNNAVPVSRSTSKPLDGEYI